ncbi:hypothetical protein [Caballeronia sp. BR00000012568055]|uniref:hypothetical protein n=1 Tax=Caballeronia sp. BR00000012568055 TaxID=2918761 RepID=UPI0023FA1D90|nr:hypothetical protein [Caballeronia sp. BR00000012568055]
MKQAHPAPESVPHSKHEKDDNVPLPHEADQSVESQDDHEPRDVGKQAHEDIKRGIVDTDRRGADDYQRATQRNEDAKRAK